MIPKVETIAIQHATGEVSRMQFVVEADASAFDAHSAVAAGFSFDSSTSTWRRQATPALINREIARTSFRTSVGPVTRHKRIAPEDVVVARGDFNAVRELT